jgi:hypothetical protein
LNTAFQHQSEAAVSFAVPESKVIGEIARRSGYTVCVPFPVERKYVVVADQQRHCP